MNKLISIAQEHNKKHKNIIKKRKNERGRERKIAKCSIKIRFSFLTQPTIFCD